MWYVIALLILIVSAASLTPFADAIATDWRRGDRMSALSAFPLLVIGFALACVFLFVTISFALSS